MKQLGNPGPRANAYAANADAENADAAKKMTRDHRPAHLRRHTAAPVVAGGRRAAPSTASPWFQPLRTLNLISSSSSSSSPSPSFSTFLAALALVAGTAVGGGCLAIPTSTAEVGFVPASVALTAVWLVLCVNGLLMVEVVVGVHQRTGRTRVSMGAMAEATLGRRWGRVLAACYAMVRRRGIEGDPRFIALMP
jgi:hypothetical protein